jgi:hypothetical protein
MSFYFSLYQIIEGVERLLKEVQHLSARALRISPRDARTNRELLETCETKLTEVRKILTSKSHISKVTLRKASFLFQILEVNYRRMVHLAASTSTVDESDDKAVKGVWQLLNLAQKHYRMTLDNVDGLTGIPASVALQGETGPPVSGFSAVIRKELDYQVETSKLLDKAVLGEEESLADKLGEMRKDLIESRRVLKLWVSDAPVNEVGVVPVGSKA